MYVCICTYTKILRVTIHFPLPSPEQKKKHLITGQVFEKIEAVGEIQKAFNVAGTSDRGGWLTWLQEKDTARKVLNECLLPLLTIVEQSEQLMTHEQRNVIMIDSLDEAATFGILRGGVGHVDTVVTMLLEYRYKWPKWLQFVATSRPDEATRAMLQPMSGARIDVKDQHNLKDIENYVALKIGKERDVAAICKSAGGVFMYASEVVRQYHEDPTIDLNGLPTGLAELYMDR